MSTYLIALRLGGEVASEPTTSKVKCTVGTSHLGNLLAVLSPSTVR